MRAIKFRRLRTARTRSSGFTLIELMIVVVIIAILAAIAYPSYVEHVRKSRRTDAKNALLDLAAREERFFSMNNAYTNTPASLGYAGTFPADVQTSGTAYYKITVTAADATSFTATAAPAGAQAADKCGTYTINQLGAQGNTGNTTASSECW